MTPSGATANPAGPDTNSKDNVFVGRSGSVAVARTFNVSSSSIVCKFGSERTGAEFTSLTITVKLCVVLKLGMPLSATATTIVLVLGPWDSFGVHVKTPVTGSFVAPIGPETKL